MDANTQAMIEHCTTFLRSNGFVVLPKERTHVVSARFIFRGAELRQSKTRLVDMAMGANARRIGDAILEKDMCIHEQFTFCDGNAYFTTKVGLIKPQAGKLLE